MPEVIDSRLTGTQSVQQSEPEILAARRAFSVAQGLLSGSPVAAPAWMTCGWYDTGASSETGSFALVSSSETALADSLIGEIVRVTVNNREVFAYVLDSADLTTDIALTRRVFMAICRPSVEAIRASVVVVE